MDYKKMFVSLLLVALVALSVSAISAADVDNAALGADDAGAAVSVDESVATDVLAGNARLPETNTSAGIQTAIAAAEAGDTIDLSVFDTYDVGNATIEVGVSDITIKGNGNTIIQGWGGPGNGIFHVTTSKVTIQGIKFIDTNPNSVLTYYDDATKNANEIKGWGIHLQRATQCVIDNCSFIDFNHGVRIQQQANDNTVSNCYFTGVTNYLRNDPTVNVEKGTKAIGVMGSQRATIVNNTFEGPMLDAVSLASGCAGCTVIGNTFIGNAYAIYFGGASTSGTKISNNTFRKVGHYEGVDARTGNPVVWDALPIISIQKAAAGIEITDNDFEAIDNNILIAAEAGNAAHGYPSEIGNIVVTGNSVTKYTSDVASASVTLLHILSRGAELNPTGPINVTDNTFVGAMKSVIFWINSWGNETGDVVIPKASLVSTTVSVTDVAQNGTVTAVVKDINGKPITGEAVSYTINGGNATTDVTDETGAIVIAGAANDVIAIKFLETDTLAASETSITLPNSTVTEFIPVLVPVYVQNNLTGTTLTINSVKVYAGGKAVLTATLKDFNGTGIANKTVTLLRCDGTNGDQTLLIGTTDASGKVSVTLNTAAAASYAVVANFNGDNATAASIDFGTVNVLKNAVAMAAPNKVYKLKAVKRVYVTLKSAGKGLAKKKIALTIAGKTIYAYTNGNGVATFTVKIVKKGNFKFTAKFAGDNAYKAITKTGIVRVVA